MKDLRVPEVAVFYLGFRPFRGTAMLLPFLKRFGKAAIAVEVSAVAGLYYIFHDINTGGPQSREKWDRRAPWLIDTFHTVTGDDRVISHRGREQQEQPECGADR